MTATLGSVRGILGGLLARSVLRDGQRGVEGLKGQGGRGEQGPQVQFPLPSVHGGQLKGSSAPVRVGNHRPFLYHKRLLIL